MTRSRLLGPVPTVRLSRAHRDAVYEAIEQAMGLAGDLSLSLKRAAVDVDRREEVRAQVARLDTCVRMLDQLGWHSRGEGPGEYSLVLDSDVAEFMRQLGEQARGLLEEHREALLSRDDPELMDLDLDALAAARLADAALGEAVAS